MDIVIPTSDEASSQVTTLDRVPPQGCAVVHHVEASDDDMHRLMTLGLCAGRRVELVQHGDPMILRIFGTRLGVSRRLAERVLVVQCDHQGCPL
jgi:Fe2+ transport system protein FeoA